MGGVLTGQLEAQGCLPGLRQVGVDGLTAQDAVQVLPRHVVLREVVLDYIAGVRLGGVVHHGVVDEPADSRLRLACGPE